MQINLKPFQAEYLASQRRYPALIAGIGTGKTLMLLLKTWQFCEEYPGSLALIVRKEYTDLRDSTIKDFERYFEAKIDSNKEYHFENGSAIMFRHASEVAVLKNVNLSLFGMEQAEEFESEEVFTFLRDRLRRQNAPYRQGCIIANAAGHNWIWRMWVNNPASEDYHAVTASTFDNADNLPADFIEDLRRMEKDAPNHYKQYVLNSFEEIGADDILLEARLVYDSPKLEWGPKGATRKRLLAVDVARFGEDETVFTVLESHDVTRWVQTHQEIWREKSTMETVGKVLDLSRDWHFDMVVIDDTGVGGGVTDRLSEMKVRVYPFNGAEKPQNALYFNKRSEGFFRLKEMFDKGYLKILPDNPLMEQLLTIRYKFKSNGQKAIVSKDEMRKEGLKSPDRADALMMATYIADMSLDMRRDYHTLPREAALM